MPVSNRLYALLALEHLPFGLCSESRNFGEKLKDLSELAELRHLEQRAQSLTWLHVRAKRREKGGQGEAMPQRSAGILMFRSAPGLEVLLIHPGGPFWAKKDEGAWSIPKGLYEPDENPLAAAKREFWEETGCVPSGDNFIPLGEFKPGAKILTIFAVEGDFDLANFKSNNFSMEWPPKSGRMAEFPEADRAGWFSIDEAKRKILKGQLPILAALQKHLGEASQ